MRYHCLDDGMTSCERAGTAINGTLVFWHAPGFFHARFVNNNAICPARSEISTKIRFLVDERSKPRLISENASMLVNSMLWIFFPEPVPRGDRAINLVIGSRRCFDASNSICIIEQLYAFYFSFDTISTINADILASLSSKPGKKHEIDHVGGRVCLLAIVQKGNHEFLAHVNGSAS